MAGSFIDSIRPNQRGWIEPQNYEFQANLDTDLARDDQPGSTFDYAAGDGSLLGQLDFSRGGGMGQIGFSRERADRGMSGLGQDGPAVIPPPSNSGLVAIPGIATQFTQTQALIGAAALGLAACKLGLIPTAVGAGVLWFIAKQSGR